MNEAMDKLGYLNCGLAVALLTVAWPSCSRSHCSGQGRGRVHRRRAVPPPGLAPLAHTQAPASFHLLNWHRRLFSLLGLLPLAVRSSSPRSLPPPLSLAALQPRPTLRVASGPDRQSCCPSRRRAHLMGLKSWPSPESPRIRWPSSGNHRGSMRHPLLGLVELLPASTHLGADETGRDAD